MWGSTCIPTRHSEHALDLFGCEVGLHIARWAQGRVPLALGRLAPPGRGPQHRLFRQMLQDLKMSHRC